MCRKLIYLISFVVLALSLISNAQAVEPTADAYIRGSANADTNYGGDAGLLIKNNNGGDNDRKVYMRFDVSGTIMDASLDLTVSTNNEGGGGMTSPGTTPQQIIPQTTTSPQTRQCWVLSLSINYRPGKPFHLVTPLWSILSTPIPTIKLRSCSAGQREMDRITWDSPQRNTQVTVRRR